MRNRILVYALLLLAAALPQHANAQPGLTGSRVVAPGVIHKEFVLSGPFTLDVLEVTLNQPYITLESYRPNGLVRTSVQAAANDRLGHRVIGAVNADFFSFATGWPTGNQIVNGRFVQGVGSPRSHIAIDSAQRPFIDRLSFTGWVRASNLLVHAISEVNADRPAAAIVFYTTYRGSGTGTNGSGMECAVTFLDSLERGSDSLRAVVTAKAAAGNMAIPPYGGVLSGGSGSGATFLTTNVSIGDTVTLYLGFTVNLKAITQVLGGAGRILANGVNVSASSASLEQIGTDFITARHPRTFVGFNSDTTKLYLCTVDGRQATSLGMSFNEMASFLTTLGASDAFNFDGGGSTTMVVRGLVVNSPSDPGGERSVANSLQLISTAPPGALARLDIQPKRVDLYQGGSKQFQISGTDEYYNPISLPPGITWDAESQIGSISSTGLFTALPANDSGWVRVRWNTVVDSAFVVVHMLSRIYAYPSSIVMLPGERITARVRGFDVDGRKVTLPNAQMGFSSSAAALNIDATGLATATGFGTGTLTVSRDTLESLVPFNITDRDTTILPEPFTDLFAWQATPVNADTLQVAVSLSSDAPVVSPPAVKVAYSFPVSSVSLLLDCSLPFSGRPDSIMLSIYGAGNADTVQILFEDKDGDRFRLRSPQVVTWSNEWRIGGFRLSQATPLGSSSMDFPITLLQIRIDFGSLNASGGTIQGTLYIDDLRVHYPLRIVTPQILFDFESGIGGWLTPPQSNAAQLIGINIAASSLVASNERAYSGSYCGKWTFVDDAGSSSDWDVRMTRAQNNDLGSMLSGSYVGAWVYANGQTDTELQIVIRDSNGKLAAGPRFPVNHVGWKLIGTKLDAGLFTSYLNGGTITSSGNQFNGFRLRAANAKVSGLTKVTFIDKLVTSALTVPTGFHSFTVNWSSPLARLHWVVNSEISLDRYAVERGASGIFSEIGAMQAVGNSDTAEEYEFVDTPPLGGVVQYRIRQITNDGAQEFSRVIDVNTGASDVGPGGAAARTFELLQNHPNPFNPSTTISYSIPVRSAVRLTIYNILGQMVDELEVAEQEAGFHHFIWSRSVASGAYYYRLEAVDLSNRGNRYVKTKSMLMVK